MRIKSWNEARDKTELGAHVFEVFVPYGIGGAAKSGFHLFDNRAEAEAFVKEFKGRPGGWAMVDHGRP